MRNLPLRKPQARVCIMPSLPRFDLEGCRRNDRGPFETTAVSSALNESFYFAI